jgi:hypothetical protein
VIRGIWELFVATFRREAEEDDGDGRSRFVPSPLDLSVRVGHGGRDDEVERELSKISDQARALEGDRRDD